MSHPKTFPHPSHDMAFNAMPHKLVELSFDSTCNKCGGKVWGTSKNFDYDSGLLYRCKKVPAGKFAKREEERNAK